MSGWPVPPMWGITDLLDALWKIATARPSDVRDAAGRILPLDQWPARAAFAAVEVEMDPNAMVVRFESPIRALGLLGAAVGLWPVDVGRRGALTDLRDAMVQRPEPEPSPLDTASRDAWRPRVLAELERRLAAGPEPVVARGRVAPGGS